MNSGLIIVILGILACPYLILAKEKMTDCDKDNSKTTCEDILGGTVPTGVFADCLNSTRADAESGSLCNYLHHAGLMNMATNPSCDNCYVAKAMTAMKICDKFKETYAKTPIVGMPLCFESSTPYYCTTGKGDQLFLTCSVQAKACKY